MADVEAQAVGGDEGALLGDVLAQAPAKGLVHQMGGGMVGADPIAPGGIDAHPDGFAERQRTLVELA